MTSFYDSFRRQFRNLRASRLVLDSGGDASPEYAPLFIQPTAAPTGTAAAGAIYVDSTTGQLAVNDGTGFVPSAGLRRVISDGKTLTPEDSGALIVFGDAAGDTYVLPSAKAGLHFTFIVNTTVTSNQDRIDTASGDFFSGTLLQGTDSTFTQAARTGNGSSHNRINLNGGTTSGIVGDVIHVTAISDSIWTCYGQVTGTGLEASPFTTQ